MIPSSPKSHHRPIQNTVHLMKTSRRCGVNSIRSVRPIDGGDIDCYPDLRSSQQHHGDPLMYQHNRIMNNSNSNSNSNNNNNNTSDCSHRDTTSLLRFSSSSAITTGSTTVTKNKVHNKPQRQSSSNNNKIYVRIKRRAEHRKTTTTTTTALNNEKLADIVGDNDADIDIGVDDTGHPYKSLYPPTTILNNNDDLIDVGVDDTDHPYKSLYPTSTIMNSNDDDLLSGLVVGVQCEPADDDDDDVAIAEETYHSSATIATDQMANMTRNLLLAMDDNNNTIGGSGGGPLSWKNVSLLHPPPDSFVLYLTNILCKHVQEYLKIYPSRCYWVKYTDFWNTLFWKTLHHFNYDGEEECSGSIASSKIMLSYRNYIQTLYTNFLKHFNNIDLIEYRIGTNNQIIFLRACILFGANTQHQRQH